MCGGNIEIAGVLLKQITQMFVLILIGSCLYKKKMISDQGSSDFGKVLLYLVIPVVVVTCMWITKKPETMTALLQSALLSSIALIVAMLIGTLFFGKKDGVATFSSSFFNAGFIGIPLVQATLGSGAIMYISMMIVLVN